MSGKQSDQANAIAVDPAGNIYVAGVTGSPNFPLHNPLQSLPSHGGPVGGTGFLVKLTADGTIVYSTYLGGVLAYSELNAVAADEQGDAYVAGQTFAPDYPRTPSLPAGSVTPSPGAVSAAFFAKISPAGDKIVYAGGIAATARGCAGGSSCFLSGLTTVATAVALDSSGALYIAGNTGGTDLPATQGALLTQGIGAFVAKVAPGGSGLVYLTLLGKGNYQAGSTSQPANRAYAIAVDAAGDAYIVGSTTDPNFPATTSAFQPKLALADPAINPFTGPPSDGFIAKLDPSGGTMLWATFFGGTGADDVRTVAADGLGNVWITGTIGSSDFPVTSGFPGGTSYLAEFDPSGAALLYGTRVPVNSLGTALNLDSAGTVHAAGATGIVSTWTPSLTAAPRIFGLANAAGGDLTGRLVPGEVISIYGSQLAPAVPATGAFDASGFLPVNLAGVEVTIGGTLAPLLYVSETQINAVVPYEAVNMSSALLHVRNNSLTLPDFRVAVDAAAPQVFRNADRSAAAINQDGTVNSASNPAPVGSFVSIWATGTGYAPLATGQSASAAQQLCSVTIANSPQDIAPSYCGAAPGIVNGVVQINFAVSTASSYFLRQSGTASDSFSIFVKP